MRLSLVLVLVAVGVLVNVVEAKKIPWWNIKIAQEQGPNACVVETVPGTGRNFYTECKYWNSRDVCGQKAVVRYECCEGFQQVPGQQGCTGVKPLKGLLETARDLGAGKFVLLVEQAGLARQLVDNAYTLFAPSDAAFDKMQREQRRRLDEAGRNPQSPLLLYHFLERRLPSTEFRADQLVDTLHRGHQLRVNKYSSGVETVNCAEVLRKDQEASNGVVHIVDTVLDPSVPLQRDLAQVVIEDGRFAELAKAVQQSGFVGRLRTTHQPYTVFAPSDEAFQKIPKPRLENILRDRHAREALLENHIVPHPICLPAVLSEHKVRTLGPEKISMDCDRKGVSVESSRLRNEFVLASNGVLYMVDDLLLPDRAKTLVQLMEQEKLTSFLQVVRFAGLEDTFENFGEYTLFAPSEAAMYSLSQETLTTLRTRVDAARSFVLYHATQGRVTGSKMVDNQAVRSLDELHSLRLQVYRKSLGVEDAMLERQDIEGLNGCLHVINKALSPPNSSAGDILRQNGNFSIFLQAMERVMDRSPGSLDLQKPGSSFTFLVPNDEAFSRLGTARLERIMDDLPYLTRTVRNHVVDNMMASESFKTDLSYEVKTRQNAVDVVRKNGKIKVNDATMTQCDIVNTNGLIHVINKVLLPDQRLRPEA